MSRGRAVLLSMCLMTVGWSSGCALMDSGRNWLTGKRSDQSEPALDKREDKWGSMAQEGRGGHPREKADWFEKYLMSEKDQDINKSFGVE